MKRPLAAVFVAVVVSYAAQAPAVTPQITSIFPHGGRCGAEVAVEFRGTYLDGASELRFADGRLTARIDASSFRKIRALVQIPADAETGLHEFRLITRRGIYVGLFHVGPLPESFEAEGNNRPAQAEALKFPVLINGRADAADADYFRFHAEPGETVVLDAMAARFGSALDPVLTLFDEHGEEIAYSDDAYTLKDARLAYTFSRPGDYRVLVSASFLRSARDAEYRLIATNGPYAASIFPLGGQRGATVEVLVRGWNLDRVDRVWIGRMEASGEVLRRSATELRVRLELPARLAPGAYQLHVAAGGQESPAPVRFEVGELPEITLSSENPAGRTAELDAPLVVNGELLDRDGNRLHRVQELGFHAQAGDRYEFRVDSWNLGVRCDPVVTLLDADGRVLAQEDDPAPNSFIHHPATHDPDLVYVFPQAGRYRVQVHDAAYEAGPGTAYRLTIQPAKPDFRLEVRGAVATVSPGRSAMLHAVVKRTGGVHIIERFRKPDSEIENYRLIEKDGWSTPIRVSLEGLPAGVTADAVEAEPRNTIFKGNDGEELFVDGTLVSIPLRASSDAKPGLYEIRARASGAFGVEKIERAGRILYEELRALRGQPTQEQKLFLNIVEVPPLLLNSPGEMQISKGRTETLKVGLFRLDGKYSVEVRPKLEVAGWNVGSLTAAAEAEEIELPITALNDASGKPAELILEAVFEQDGRKIRVESAPIELKVKP